MVNVCISIQIKGSHQGHDRMVVGLKLPLQSMPITNEVVSLNPPKARCTRNNTM